MSENLSAEGVPNVVMQSIAWLPIGIFPQGKLETVKSFAYPHRVNPTSTRSRFQLFGPDTHPDMDLFFLFNP